MRAMTEAVTDDMVEQIAVCGTTADACAALARRPSPSPPRASAACAGTAPSCAPR